MSETSRGQRPLHRGVVLACVRINPVERGIRGEEMVNDPLSASLATAASAMAVGDSEIEQGCAVVDVTQIKKTNESYSPEVVNHPEA